MAQCDVCGRDATVFVTCDANGLGGSPAYGSFRSFRCDMHGRVAVEQHQAAGLTAKVQPLTPVETREPCELCNGTGDFRDHQCPDCGGSGHQQADGFCAPEGVNVREVA